MEIIQQSTVFDQLGGSDTPALFLQIIAEGNTNLNVIWIILGRVYVVIRAVWTGDWQTFFNSSITLIFNSLVVIDWREIVRLIGMNLRRLIRLDNRQWSNLQ